MSLFACTKGHVVHLPGKVTVCWNEVDLACTTCAAARRAAAAPLAALVARVATRRLTDDSEVYDVAVTDRDVELTLCCVDLAAAASLSDLINRGVVSFDTRCL